MKVTFAGSMVWWANVGGNEVFTLDVVCSAITTNSPTNPVVMSYDASNPT